MDRWISAADITAWGEKLGSDCRDNLSELIHRLIRATASVESIDQCRFPCGMSVTMEGWDGELKTTAKRSFFPEGISGWEVSCDRSPGRKADHDYATRTKDSLGLVKRETTYVCVTTRPWKDGPAWARRMEKQKKWKAVQVITADDLESWLKHAPAVAYWLATKIGKVLSDGVMGLEEVWDVWSSGMKPTMMPHVVISGREREVEKIRTWASDAPAICELQSDSPEEAFAFLYGAFNSFPDAERYQTLSRCVVVQTPQELYQCVRAYQEPLIFAAPAECIEQARHALTKGHHVFVVKDQRTIDPRSDLIRLRRAPREALEKALKENGLSDSEARKNARECGGSITILRRLLPRTTLIRKPQWADNGNIQNLLPALLAGAWVDTEPGDRKVIEILAGKDFESFQSAMQPLIDCDDPPLQRIGPVWTIKAPLDAWFLLGHYITDSDLERFRVALKSVLLEIDPKYDLQPEQRWMASVHGKRRLYSEWLSKGLVGSLSLLAVHGSRDSRRDSEGFSGAIVLEILGNATTWEAWSSLKEVTPLLAEASPETFLGIVEEKLSLDSNIFVDLMKDDGSIPFGECRHSGLLWALESLAWHPDYFPRSAAILCDLAMIDAGGRWANRPISSLTNLFLPDIPQTYAPPLDRLNVFKALSIKAPTTLWKVSAGIMGQGSLTAAPQFRWRHPGGYREAFQSESVEDRRSYIEGLLPLWKELISANEENAIEALEDFQRLPVELKEEVILKFIDPKKISIFSQSQKEKIRSILREKLSWANTYGREDLKDYIPQLEKALGMLASNDVIERVGWLLSSPWPEIPEGKSKNREESAKMVDKLQLEAARELLNEATIDQILDYSKSLQYRHIVSFNLGKAVKPGREDTKVLDSILKRFDEFPDHTTSYARGREAMAKGWILKTIARMKKKALFQPAITARLLLGLPHTDSTWVRVSSYGSDTESEYWKIASHWIDAGADAAIAVEKFLGVGRPDEALELASDERRPIPGRLLKALLKDLVSFKSETPPTGSMFGYNLGLVLKKLYEENESSLEELARLEWPYAGIFSSLEHSLHQPLAIHRYLQKEPSFFIQLVDLCYRRDDRRAEKKVDDFTAEQKKRIVSNAGEVLYHWHLVPGFNTDGSVDGKALNVWIDTARSECAKIQKTIGCDIQIAKIISNAPPDADGNWPHKIVRDLIERLKSSVVDEHVPIAIYNNRGVVSRSLHEGGNQERLLSDKYGEMAKALNSNWPRTAAILRALSRSYDNDARREDISAKLREIE